MRPNGDGCWNCKNHDLGPTDAPCIDCESMLTKWEMTDYDKEQKELTELRAFKEACEGQEATWYSYRINDHWDGFSGEAPPEDSYDEGTLIALYVHPDPEAANLRRRVKELEALSVTNILIDIVPGDEGNGEEVYAASVADIEKLIGRLGEKAEDYELETVPLRRQRDELRGKLSELKAQLATRDQQVAEACAKAAEAETKVARECLAAFGDNAAAHCQVAFVIRSGEWKKHMKGVE